MDEQSDEALRHAEEVASDYHPDRHPVGLGRTTRTARDGSAVVVLDDPPAIRFEAAVDGVTAAFARYALDDDHVVFTHTVTQPEWSGRGIGSALAAGALELVARAGRRVVPRCPFIADHLHRHPELAHLVDESDRHLIRAWDTDTSR